MALSPPLANSLTIAVIIPVPPSTTTEYCRSAVSCENDQGSTRVPPPGVRLTVCVKASEPPAKLYQLIVTVVAVTLCRRMGVLQPVVCVGVGQKQSDFVRFGRKNLVAGVAVAGDAVGGGCDGVCDARLVGLRVDHDGHGLVRRHRDRVLLVVGEAWRAEGDVV